jgi:hypothetical protein
MQTGQIKLSERVLFPNRPAVITQHIMFYQFKCVTIKKINKFMKKDFNLALY